MYIIKEKIGLFQSPKKKLKTNGKRKKIGQGRYALGDTSWLLNKFAKRKKSYICTVQIKLYFTDIKVVIQFFIIHI